MTDNTLAPRAKGRIKNGKPLHIRVAPDEKERWRAAAQLDGRDLAGWVRRTLNIAATEQLAGADYADDPALDGGNAR